MSYYHCSIKPKGYAEDQTARKKVFAVVTKLWRDRDKSGVRIDYHQALKNSNSEVDPQEFQIDIPKARDSKEVSREKVEQLLHELFPREWLRDMEIDDESVLGGECAQS